MHHFPLLTLLAAAFTAAWALGLLTHRIGMSPIVGYILAGVLIGPFTFGIIDDDSLAPQLAELGVILLMFGVGLHFHLKDLMAVRSIAIPGAMFQSLTTVVAGILVFRWLGMPLSAGLVLGIAMAVSSTVVLTRMLIDNHRLNTVEGHTAVGWTIMEDIFTVVALVLLPVLAGLTVAEGELTEVSADQSHWLILLGIALGKLVLMAFLLFFVGSKVMPWFLVNIAAMRSRELFTLTILVFSIAVATGASIVFGASVALGAFLAGMVVAQSPVSQQAGIDALPLRDAFAVIFFVAVGMLFDPQFIIDHPLLLLGGLTVIMLIRPIAAILIVSVLGFPVRTGLTVALTLSQIGEFSFILGDLARQKGLISQTGSNLLVACALVSITLNPLLFRLLEPIERGLRKNPKAWNFLNGHAERKIKQLNAQTVAQIETLDRPLAIVVGYGPVGQQVDRLLRQAGIETLIIDLNMDTISNLLGQNRLAVYGDASHMELLEQAGIAKASHLVLSMPHVSNQQMLLATARQLNPEIRLLVRTRYLRDSVIARQFGANITVADEVESAVALTELVLSESDTAQDSIREETKRLREDLFTQS